MVTGAVLLVLYVRHALRVEAPIIDLRLLKRPAFRASVGGRSCSASASARRHSCCP